LISSFLLLQLSGIHSVADEDLISAVEGGPEFLIPAVRCA
jgi:hypothetical protein